MIDALHLINRSSTAVCYCGSTVHDTWIWQVAIAALTMSAT